MSGYTSRAALQMKKVVRTAVPVVMKKLIHVQELFMVCWLQALLFMLETKHHKNIFHHH